MKKIIASVLFLIIIASLQALDLSEGKIKLKLYEASGRFSVYYLDDVSASRYIPLIFDKDPETTSLVLGIDNKIYTMGKSSFFKQDILKNSSKSASFVWTSDFIKVTETFTLIKSIKSAFTDGVKIVLSIENIGNVAKNVGVSYLFDTYLGENGKKHFITSNGNTINDETSFIGSFPSFFISPFQGKSFEGLQLMIKGIGITVPDKVIFANWKRLKNNLLDFKSHPSRKFNLLPYSINDSAVDYYYKYLPIQKDGKRSITIVLGAATGSEFVGKSENQYSSEINKLYIQTAETNNKSLNVESSIKTDLIAVKDLLSKINDKIAVPDKITDEDITLIKQVIDNLEQRKELYGKK